VLTKKAIPREDERFAVDYVTHGLLSASLLAQFVQLLYSDKRDTMTIGQFYDRFSATHQSRRFRPFNEGVVLSFMYLGLLFARENWPDLVPDDALPRWNILPVRLAIGKCPQPTLKYLVRRLRNSLVHGTPTITVPVGTTTENMAKAVTLTFKDTNPKDTADTFEAELTMEDTFHIAKMLHSTVVADVADRYEVTTPCA
jgi:hypothetical protein